MRVRITVGAPFHSTAESQDLREDLGGLAAYADPDGCLVAFPIGYELGIALHGDGECTDFTQLSNLAEGVAAALQSPTNAILRQGGRDSHAACALLEGAARHGDTLTDGNETSSNGLDSCQIMAASGSRGTHLDLSYLGWSIDRVASVVGGEIVRIGGQDVSLAENDDRSCSVRINLWQTRATGRGAVSAHAIVGATSCREARRVSKEVIAAAHGEPPAPDDLASLVTSTAS